MKSRLVVVGGAVAFVVVGLIAWEQLRGMSAPLTWNLGGGKWAVLSERFSARLEQAFPVGSSEEQMLAELQRQGFVILPIASTSESERQAVRREDNFVCNVAARVYWHTDTGGRIVAIRGVDREEGCL